MSSSYDSRRLFVPTPTQREHRSFWANLTATLTDETIANASAWVEETPISIRSDVPSSLRKLIGRFCEHTVAHALARGNADLLAVAARAGFLETHVVADDPRARHEGPSDRSLALVMEAAPLLGIGLDAIAPNEAADVVSQLVAQTRPSRRLDDTEVLVERWGAPSLAMVWNEAWVSKRPEPSAATFDWWLERWPWDQIGPVTLEEPAADELTGSGPARRLATEFGRTGAIETGLQSAAAAVENDLDNPAWMALWIAHLRAGDAGVTAFNRALASAGLPTEPGWTPPSDQRVGDTVVTGPWTGPFFDRLLTVSPPSDGAGAEAMARRTDAPKPGDGTRSERD